MVMIRPPAEDTIVLGWLVELTGAHRGQTQVFRKGSTQVDGAPGVAFVGTLWGFELVADSAAGVQINGESARHRQVTDRDRINIGARSFIWIALL